MSWYHQIVCKHTVKVFYELSKTWNRSKQKQFGLWGLFKLWKWKMVKNSTSNPEVDRRVSRLDRRMSKLDKRMSNLDARMSNKNHKMWKIWKKFCAKNSTFIQGIVPKCHLQLKFIVSCQYWHFSDIFTIIWTYVCPIWTYVCPIWTSICPEWTYICPYWTNESLINFKIIISFELTHFVWCVLVTSNLENWVNLLNCQSVTSAGADLFLISSCSFLMIGQKIIFWNNIGPQNIYLNQWL